MAAERIQYCFNCVKELGVYRSYPGDLETCGDPECEREARYQCQMQQDEARERAEEDGFSLYGGRW